MPSPVPSISSHGRPWPSMMYSSGSCSPAPSRTWEPNRRRTVEREGVVIAVDMGDQEPAHVTELVADAGQRGFQLLPGLGQRPAGVDQGQAAAVGDRVDVDRPQPVVGQRKRDPVHARSDGECPRQLPVARARDVLAVLPGRLRGRR